MSVIPCEQRRDLREKIIEYTEILKTQAHTLGEEVHGLDEAEFYNSGLFRGTIERIRGQFVATMQDKREFVRNILNHMQDNGFIRNWAPAGDANRHDYTVNLRTGRTAVIELKGCLDGNNTTIFERPANASEFIIWSVCTNPGADPRRNAWSGIHTRLSAEIISNEVLVDGIVIWDMVCGTIGRRCPKLSSKPPRPETVVGRYTLPPPCIYLLPSTIPHPRTNPNPQPHMLADVQILQAFNDCFNCEPEEINYVSFEVAHEEANTVRTTRIVRNNMEVQASPPTIIRRA